MHLTTILLFIDGPFGTWRFGGNDPTTDFVQYPYGKMGNSHDLHVEGEKGLWHLRSSDVDGICVRMMDTSTGERQRSDQPLFDDVA